MRVRWWSRRDRWAVIAAVVLPFGVCLALVPFRRDVPNTDAALILVAAVVAVAADGHRVAGVLASMSAALCFDFLLTAPYDHLSITDRRDVETTLLLLVVGTAVTELAVRGRRNRTLALTDARYLDAIQRVSALAEAKASPAQLTAEVSTQVTDLLGLAGCRFETRRFGGLPSLEPDGRVRVGDDVWNVDQYGMPDHEIELLASVRGRVQGRLVLEPTPGVIPPLAARRCAVVVAGQLAAALPSDRVRAAPPGG